MTAVSAFDEATAARRLEAGRYEVRPDDRFAIGPPSGDGQAAVNGGVLLAMVLRAVMHSEAHDQGILDGAAAGHPAQAAARYPVATSAHFLRVPRVTPAEVQVTWLKHGKTAAVARAALIQDGALLIDTTITTGTLPTPHPAAQQTAGRQPARQTPARQPGGQQPAARQTPARQPGGQQRAARQAAGTGEGARGSAVPGSAAAQDGRGPTALGSAVAQDGRGPAALGSAVAQDGGGPAEPGSAADRAVSLTWTGAPPALPPVDACVPLRGGNRGFSAQVDLRLDPATAGWLDGQPSQTPEMRGYFQLREHQDPDAYLLALAVDALPPVVFGLGAIGWAPTVELSWYMRAVPAPGRLVVAARSRHVSGGWFDEEAEVWDSAGQLVAQSRQLARVGRPSA
jgi:hypothetical protein